MDDYAKVLEAGDTTHSLDMWLRHDQTLSQIIESLFRLWLPKIHIHKEREVLCFLTFFGQKMKNVLKRN